MREERFTPLLERGNSEDLGERVLAFEVELCALLFSNDPGPVDVCPC